MNDTADAMVDTQLSRTAADQRIRVVQVTGALDFGGAEKVIAHLSTGLDPARYQVSIVCTRGIGTLGQELQAQGVDVVLTRPYVRSRRFLAPLDMYRVLRRLRPHVVHTHGEPPLAAVGPLGYCGLLPYWVHTFHYGNYPYAESKRMLLERVLCRPASHLIAVADQQRATLLKHHGISAHRIGTLMNGVRPNENLEDAALAAGVRAEFGLSASDYVIGTIAVLSKQKGVSYLLQAAKDVVAKHPNVKLLIVGGGPLEQELRAQSRSLGVESNVLFAGWRKDVQRILPALDVFVMSSLWEAMPLTLLEAMAARRPMIVTEVGDNAKLCANGECALLVPPADSAALAGAMTRLIGAPALAESLAARALSLFNERYTVRHMVAAHERLYQAAARGA